MRGLKGPERDTVKRLRDACEYNDQLQEDIEDLVWNAATTAEIALEEDLYTNALMSWLAPLDNCIAISAAHGLLLMVCILQAVITVALLMNIEISFSFSSAKSVAAKKLHDLYDDLLSEGRLEYMRLEEMDVEEICGRFHFSIEESATPGTRWGAFFEYKKLPVGSWSAGDIPPTQRSILDDARFVLENTTYGYVFGTIAAVWMLTILHHERLALQYLWAFWQMETISDGSEPLEREGEQYHIRGLTPIVKVSAVTCCIYRIVLIAMLGYVGCEFLRWTASSIDLFLNALALVFVLELGNIVYQATVSRARQHLISNLRPVTYHDPTHCRRLLDARNWLHMVIAVVLVVAGAVSLREGQFAGYQEKFHLAASICLFQGPTPGYWSSYAATFPVPGLCETLLQLRCQFQVYGEKGTACYQDTNQLLCKFYTRAPLPGSSWADVDWKETGPCVSVVNDEVHHLQDVRFPADRTRGLLGRACQAMWQPVPAVNFRNRTLAETGPRTRVYPYRKYVPAAPFWCPFTDGADAVLTDGGPSADPKAWDLLKRCGSRTLAYSTRHSGVVLDRAPASQGVDADDHEEEENEDALFGDEGE